MEILNQNIESTLDNMDISEQDKNTLKAILYQERHHKEHNWDTEAPKEIQVILRQDNEARSVK